MLRATEDIYVHLLHLPLLTGVHIQILVQLPTCGKYSICVQKCEEAGHP